MTEVGVMVRVASAATMRTRAVMAMILSAVASNGQDASVGSDVIVCDTPRYVIQMMVMRVDLRERGRRPIEPSV